MNVSDAEAIERAGCPSCGQPISAPCIYQLPRAERYANTPRPPSMRAKVERVGTPTKHVHPERRDVVRKLRHGEQPGTTGIAARNELRILEKLTDGRWHDEEQILDEHTSWPAFTRCRDAAWIESGQYSWLYHLTELGRLRLKGLV